MPSLWCYWHLSAGGPGRLLLQRQLLQVWAGYTLPPTVFLGSGVLQIIPIGRTSLAACSYLASPLCISLAAPIDYLVLTRLSQ